MTSGLDIFLWVVLPYVCLTIFVIGHVWRYRYDKFGWTTRSSQLYENRLLRLGSPLFHFGILFVLLGHVMGLGVPSSWTGAVGMSEGLYHFLTVSVLWRANTVIANIFGHYDYREGVSVWFRGIFLFSLHPELMSAAPLGFKLHG